MPGIGKIGLRAPLLALQRARLGRLREMHLSTDPLELLHHEPPADRRLQRDLKTGPTKRVQERADTGPVCRHDPRARDLTGDRVDPLRCDLRPVLIQAHHHRHAATPSHNAAGAPQHTAPTGSASHTVNHGRYLLFDWPAARPLSARAYNAVRRGGPATFTTQVTSTGT